MGGALHFIADDRTVLLIFDLDGVVYLGDTAIPGAVESLNALAASGHALYYLTNNSTRSRRTYADKLTGLGIATRPEQVMTSAYATALFLQEQGAAGKRAYVVGEVGLREELSAIGMTVFAEDDASPADYVVAGLDRALTFAKLRTAHEQITRHGAAFIAQRTRI